MHYVLSDIHGNSVASGIFRKKITLADAWAANKDSFRELHDFFTVTFGPSYDVDTRNILRTNIPWSYQLEKNSGQHSFFVKSDEQLEFFLLKYAEGRTNWS
jgi:hypothetical protein